jgi:hypothetical protein
VGDRRGGASDARLSVQSVNTLSGPRLSQATDAGSRTSDTSDAVGANAMILNSRTRGGRRSDRRYCAASVGLATDATVQRLSPLFLLCGEAND